MLLLSSPPCESCSFSPVPHFDDKLVDEERMQVVMATKEEEGGMEEEMCAILQPFEASE